MSGAFIARPFLRFSTHWHLSKRLLFLLMAMLHRSVSVAMWIRVCRGSWFAMRNVDALAPFFLFYLSFGVLDVANISL